MELGVEGSELPHGELQRAHGYTPRIPPRGDFLDVAQGHQEQHAHPRWDWKGRVHFAAYDFADAVPPHVLSCSQDEAL
jgi:hypothetical protein